VRNNFAKEMEELHTELIEMGALCETAIGEVQAALVTGDTVRAEKVRQSDAAIDSMEKKIENKCLRLMLREQPVASDLRKISAALKMVTDLERIGDQAEDIAEILTEAEELRAAAQLVPLAEMARAAKYMVTASIDAYVRQELKLANKVIEYDDVVDELFLRTRHKLVAAIDAKAGDAASLLDLFMIAKYYERIGDHATNIAEWVVFAGTGEHK